MYTVSILITPLQQLLFVYWREGELVGEVRDKSLYWLLICQWFYDFLSIDFNIAFYLFWFVLNSNFFSKAYFLYYVS